MIFPLGEKRPSQLAVFALALVAALTFALLTQHVWEDYYITLRSSKNLVAGNGLVFNKGDRLHTFTSPLGVLVPAAAVAVTGNSSDLAALWMFRLWSSLAFAGAAVLAYSAARRFQYGSLALTALVAWVVLDAKSLDFTINGMETGFLLLFIAYAVWALFACRRYRWQHLGVAWAGLMWTRPDSFLYVALLAAGVFFFNDAERSGLTRRQCLGLFLRAGVLCTLLYLPWIVWAWWYYGTPIPNTITAKGGVTSEAKTALGILKTFLDFPWTVWTGSTSLESTFLPSYYQLGGWPQAAVTTARWVAVLVAFQWVLPWWRMEVRVASFAFAGMHVYLSYFPFFPFPWYLPGTAFLAALTLGGMVAQMAAETEQRAARHRPGMWPGAVKKLLLATVVVVTGAQAWLTYQMQRQMAAEQTYTADAVRHEVGVWLKANGHEGDTVFMEPLGHIGYFSNLKTYDFPGLSSREVVEAIRAVGTDWGFLAEYLSPDWLVLRQHEILRMEKSVRRLFADGASYKLVKEFNNLPAIAKLGIYGRDYVAFDAHLFVYRRQVPKRYQLDMTGLSPFEGLGVSVRYLDAERMYMIHATGMMSVRVPSGATRIRIAYGMPADSYDGPVKTDGVEFTIRWTDGRKTNVLLSRLVQPQLNAGDQGLQWFEAELPAARGQATVILTTLAGDSDPMDWSLWGVPTFK